MEAVPCRSIMRTFLKKQDMSLNSSSQGQGDELGEASGSLVKSTYQAAAIVSPIFPLIGERR